jgi:thiol:disulfide interchange protein DsbA
MFKALHEQNRPLWLNSELARFYAGFGVKEADFTRAFNSFGVRAGIQRSEMLTRAYQINGVPAMVVNGKYVVDGRMAGSNEAMLQVVDFLVARERAARRAAPAAGNTRPAAPASR